MQVGHIWLYDISDLYSLISFFPVARIDLHLEKIVEFFIKLICSIAITNYVKCGITCAL